MWRMFGLDAARVARRNQPKTYVTQRKVRLSHPPSRARARNCNCSSDHPLTINTTNLAQHLNNRPTVSEQGMVSPIRSTRST